MELSKEELEYVKHDRKVTKNMYYRLKRWDTWVGRPLRILLFPVRLIIKLYNWTYSD